MSLGKYDSSYSETPEPISLFNHNENVSKHTSKEKLVENKEEQGIVRKNKLNKLIKDLQLRNEKARTVELLKIESPNKLDYRKKIIDDVSTNANDADVIAFESSNTIEQKKDCDVKNNTAFQPKKYFKYKEKKYVVNDNKSDKEKHQLLFGYLTDDNDLDAYLKRSHSDSVNDNVMNMNPTLDENESIPAEQNVVSVQTNTDSNNLFNDDSDNDIDSNSDHNSDTNDSDNNNYYNTLQREDSTDSFIADASDKDTYNYDYATHLEHYNTLNREQENSSMRPLSERQSMQLYIEYVTLCLLSPTLKYDPSFFKVSKNIKRIANNLQSHYSQLCESIMQPNFTDNRFKSKGNRNRKRKAKRRKLLKKALSESSSDKSAGEEKNSYLKNKTDLKKRKLKRKKVLADSDSEEEEEKEEEQEGHIQTPKQNREQQKNDEIIIMISDDKANGDSQESDSNSDNDGFSFDDNGTYEIEDCFTSDSSSLNENQEMEESSELDSLGSTGESRNSLFQTQNIIKKVKQQFKEDIEDKLLYEILNNEMLEYYSYFKENEDYRSYEFFKMIHRLSKPKSHHDYKYCINKIENHILSKRDQFESNHFKKEFKNILENYAYLYDFIEDNGQFPIFTCGCCTRKIKSCSYIFLHMPFYNSKELWDNSFYNFMRVHNFEWLGQIPFKDYANPLKDCSRKKNDMKQSERIKKIIYSFMKTFYDNLVDSEQSVLAPFNSNVVEKNRNVILEHLRQEEAIIHNSENILQESMKKNSSNNFNFFLNNTNTELKKFDLTITNIFNSYHTLYKPYIRKEIFLIGLGMQCKVTVKHWHGFHHFKYFWTKKIYNTLLQLYQSSSCLFREPLLVAYIISKKLCKPFYKEFKFLMNAPLKGLPKYGI